MALNPFGELELLCTSVAELTAAQGVFPGLPAPSRLPVAAGIIACGSYGTLGIPHSCTK